MTTRKKIETTISENPKLDSVVTKTTNQLIFISHDSRDAELADEFSNLLKSASAGALKSFVSSDKKGTRGIEYGLEWYPAIMDKIDEATDVVCLLTQRSVERPWILYEAGVAKGKLGKKVIGIAMGIQHSVAFTGPFAQFQNNDGSVDAISKLVLDLVRKVPGLDPDQKLVEQLVQGFHTKATEILAKTQKKPEKSLEAKDDKMVVKLFEEVKLMFESLPSRIENRIDPDQRRRRRKFHPMMFDDMMHMGIKSGDTDLGFLIMISFFRDEIPWIYEIGVETYRSLKNAKNITEKKKVVLNFEKAIQMLNHPMFMEFSGSEEMFMMSKDLKSILPRYLNKYLTIDNNKE
jgi:hypothetical protein